MEIGYAASIVSAIGVCALKRQFTFLSILKQSLRFMPVGVWGGIAGGFLMAHHKINNATDEFNQSRAWRLQRNVQQNNRDNYIVSGMLTWQILGKAMNLSLISTGYNGLLLGGFLGIVIDSLVNLPVEKPTQKK